MNYLKRRSSDRAGKVGVDRERRRGNELRPLGSVDAQRPQDLTDLEVGMLDGAVSLWVIWGGNMKFRTQRDHELLEHLRLERGAAIERDERWHPEHADPRLVERARCRHRLDIGDRLEDDVVTKTVDHDEDVLVPRRIAQRPDVVDEDRLERLRRPRRRQHLRRRWERAKLLGRSGMSGRVRLSGATYPTSDDRGYGLHSPADPAVSCQRVVVGECPQTTTYLGRGRAVEDDDVVDDLVRQAVHQLAQRPPLLHAWEVGSHDRDPRLARFQPPGLFVIERSTEVVGDDVYSTGAVFDREVEFVEQQGPSLDPLVRANLQKLQVTVVRLDQQRPRDQAAPAIQAVDYCQRLLLERDVLSLGRRQAPRKE